MAIKPFLFLALPLIFLSCQSGPENYKDFDVKSWKADPEACNGKRNGMTNALEAIRSELINMEEPKLREILGKPDRIELLERNQKVYQYYVTSGKQCAGDQVSERDGQVFVVRFTPTNKVKEALLLVD
jgi:hypothetical protein